MGTQGAPVVPNEGGPVAPSEGGRIQRRQTRVPKKRPRRAHGVAVNSKRNHANHIKRKRLCALVDAQLAADNAQRERQENKRRRSPRITAMAAAAVAEPQPTPRIIPISAQATCHVARPIDCCVGDRGGGLPPLVVQQDNDYDSSDNEDEEAGEEIITSLRPASSRPYQPPIKLHTPRMVTQCALNALTINVWNDHNEVYVPAALSKPNAEAAMPNIEHFCAPVVHPKTGEIITKYAKLAEDADPEIRETWRNGLGKEFGNMAQGDDRTGTPGMDAIHVLDHEQIRRIPKGKTVTYARLVVDFRPQKKDPNRVRMTAGGNLIKYAGDITTRTADLTTAKIVWNSVLSTAGAKYACFDISNMYLHTPLAPEDYEYMRIPLKLLPEHTIQQYGLREKALKGMVYVEMRRCVYGLPQAGALANKLLKERLAPAGYYEVRHTPGLWKHISRPVAFSLVVDDFGVKYVGKQNADHLVAAIEKYYPLSDDWKGELYCGISLRWDYEKRTLDIGMPGYIKKALAKYKHEAPRKPQHSPYPVVPRKYGAAAQDPIPPDESPKLEEGDRRRIQQVVGTILYYARAVDMTVLAALSSIASQQSKATEGTMAQLKHMLDYLATHPDATVRFHASDMILNIHSDASYLSEPGGKSRAAGHFFLGWIPRDGEPIRLNGAFFTLCSILKFVAASAAEAELGALFLNMREGRIFRLALEELGHPQPPTPIHCDNATAAGIVNGTIRRQRSRMFEMRYFYACDQVDKKYFLVYWHPGAENLGDYASKHHEAAHHKLVRPIYLHETNSPRVLVRALTPQQVRALGVGKTPSRRGRSSPGGR